MAWKHKQAVEYYKKNSKYEFQHGSGCYNVVVGGVLFALAVDFEKNIIRVMTICLAKPFNESGYCGPLTDGDGNIKRYSTRVNGV